MTRTPATATLTRTRRHAIWATTLLVTREAVRSFLANNNSQTAATLACYATLALMPLLLLVVMLLGAFLQSSEALHAALLQSLAGVFPTASSTVIEDLLRLSHGRTWGLVSVILLFWSVTPFASAFRTAITRIFRSGERLHFLSAKVLDVTAAFAILLLFVLLVGTRVLTVSTDHGMPSRAIAAINVLRHLAVFLLTALVLVFFYRVFSAQRIRIAHLLSGAAVAAALLAVLRPLFGLLLHYNPNYGYAFGSLKAIFLLIVWVYYTFGVILFGAEVGAAIRRRNALLLSQLFSVRRDTRRTTQQLLSKFLRRYDQGDVVFREGDPGDSMFYVQSGKVDIRKHDCILKTVGPGEYLGEMAMLLDSPRTATAVTALPDTELIEVADDNLEIILRENPQILRRFLKEMASRLKETSDHVQQRTQGETQP